MIANLQSSPAPARLPAYGRELVRLREQGLVPKAGAVVVAIDDWNLRGRRPDFGRVVVAAEDDPASLCFKFLAGLDAWVVYRSRFTSVVRARQVIERVCQFNPLRLLWINYDAEIPRVTFARKAGSLDLLELPR